MIKEGIKNDKVIAFWDILPTLADLINYPHKLKTDGISILPDLKGEQGRQHTYLYWDYGHARNTYKQAIRYGKYKGLKTQIGKEVHFELYDLKKDRGEKNNIAGSNPEIVEKIKQMMQEAYEYSPDYPRKAEY